MLKKSLIAIVALFSLSTAQAGLHLEPIVGYAMSGATGTADTPYSGLGFGARVGYGMLGFSAGVSYAMGTVNIEETTTTLGFTTTIDIPYDKTSLGAYVAYEFPILLRAFATYNFSDTIEHLTGSKQNGNGISFGVGYTGLPLLAINAELRNYTYNESETAAGVTSALAADISASDIFISVSLPYSF